MTATLDAPVAEAFGRSGRVVSQALTEPEGHNPKKGIFWERVFSPTADPYETIPLEFDDVVLTKAGSDEVVFDQRDILFPTFWDKHARSITAQHYLKGRLGTTERESSVPQMINRVVDTIVAWAQNGRAGRDKLPPLFVNQESADNFAADLKFLIITQVLNFNSPVWYNIGIPGVPQTPSACFILEVHDTMRSILGWYTEEGIVFQGGSGAGTNLSQIRSSYEGLSRGGWASGPVSYMCGADASAGTMKSGGRSRRAAKMVVLDIDHPDILETANGDVGFIRAKSEAEKIIRDLYALGYDMRVDSGKHSKHVQFQNANNSVRVNNEFMECVLAGAEWQTRARRPDLVIKPVPKYDARELWHEVAKAAWECADPGVQYDSTINFFNTTPAAGRIMASNPCSEYMHLNNSPCNLAASNLLKFLGADGSWDIQSYTQAVRLMALAQTIMAAYGDYPTERVRQVATGFRQIGQGYTNLGATLKTNGLAYDSDEGRAWGAAYTALMQGALHLASADVAAVWGAYQGVVSDDPDLALPGFDHPENRKAHLKVAELHREYAKAIAKQPSRKAARSTIQFGGQSHLDIFHNEIVGGGRPVQNDRFLRQVVQAAVAIFDTAIERAQEFGFANAHMSVLAPMGTNGYMMGNDTTGIEPAFSMLIKKQKVSGDHMTIEDHSNGPALRKLGYSPEQIEDVLAYIVEHNSVVGAPFVAEEHYPVFDTAINDPVGGRFISIDGHNKMMGAAQPFISGAISKTGNLPNEATVEEIERVYTDGWRFGLKAMAIYRDGSKAVQPMSAVGKEKESLTGPPTTVRHKLPRVIDGRRIKLRIVDPVMGEFELYALCGVYPDGSLGEIFEIAGAEGTLVNGLLAFSAKQISNGLQHGVPLRDALKMGLNMSFPPFSSMIPPSDSDFTSCTSIVDLLCRELALQFLPLEERHELGIYTRQERAAMTSEGYGVPAAELPVVSVTPSPVSAVPAQRSGPKPKLEICFKCSIPMEPTGTCFTCPQCYGTTGCV